MYFIIASNPESETCLSPEPMNYKSVFVFVVWKYSSAAIYFSVRDT